MKTRLGVIDEGTDALRLSMTREPDAARDFVAKFDMSVVYHENALEGIVFSGAELLAALDPNAIAADASMVPVFAFIRNHKVALDLVHAEARNKKGKFSQTLIKRLYETLGAGFEGREKAVFRKDVPLHRTYFHEIAPPAKIPSLVEKLVDHTNSAEFREMHAIHQAATLQWMFMQAFPFAENSGKIARLLSHLCLLRQGYLPALVHAIDRQRYYESLRLPVTALRQLLVEASENALENAFKFFAAQVRGRLPRASGQ